MTLPEDELGRLVIDEIRAVRAEMLNTAEPDDLAGQERTEWYIERALTAKGDQAQLPEALNRLRQLWPET